MKTLQFWRMRLPSLRAASAAGRTLQSIANEYSVSIGCIRRVFGQLEIPLPKNTGNYIAYKGQY